LLVLTDAPLRQAVVPLQRGQIRSPAQALSNADLQFRHTRCKRASSALLGFDWYPDVVNKRRASRVMGQFLNQT
jgi:hypothetical protein